MNSYFIKNKEGIIKLFNSKYFFVFVLLIYLAINFALTYKSGLDSVSSDVWMNNYVMMQKVDNVWSYQPDYYSQQELYLAFPLLYYVNPGFSNGVWPYHIIGFILIIVTYLISGLVIKKVFNNWWLAALGAFLCVVPRFILPTRIGIMGLGNVRGNAFVYPLYLLLSYYWLIYGLKDKRKNIYLAIVAGLSVYLYPPVGLIIVGIFILTGLLLYRKKYLKEIINFGIIYLLVASPFLLNHFMNPGTSMLDAGADLSSDDSLLQLEIVKYRFEANAFLSSIDLARIKRGLWDGFILAITFFGSILFYRKYWDIIKDKYKQLVKISLTFFILMIIFVLSVELMNYVASINNKPPIFVEHLRLMRALGFIFIMQFIFVVYLLYYKLNKKLLALLITLLIVVTPIQFFAPVIRVGVRAIIPESIRLKYNLAPVVEEEATKFPNLYDIAIWSKNNLNDDNVKVFVFDDFQNEFRFKILSRLDTNLTAKEGNMYVTSNFDDSRTWYEERTMYNDIVESAENFSQILDFAKDLNCNYMLLPKGKYEDLYEASGIDTTEVLYSNYDYKVLKIN